MLFRNKVVLLAELLCLLCHTVAVNTTIACNNSPMLCDRAWSNTTQLGAHDSPFVRDASNSYSLSGDQYYNSTAQLSAGVRLLTGQIYPTNSTDGLHLCHTSCDLYDAGKLSQWLIAIKAWLDENPYDVITILLVNGGDSSGDDIAVEFEDSGIVTYAYTPSSTSEPPTDGIWPTLRELIANGTRLITFIASLSSETSAATYLLNEFTFVFENPYDNTNLTSFSCTPQRPSSVAGSISDALDTGLLPLQNHFLYTEALSGLVEIPDVTDIYQTNAPLDSVNSTTGSLGESAMECTEQYGRAPTFLLVDFSNIGPAIDTVDVLNGVTNATGRTSISSSVVSTSAAVNNIVNPAGLLVLIASFSIHIFV